MTAARAREAPWADSRPAPSSHAHTSAPASSPRSSGARSAAAVASSTAAGGARRAASAGARGAASGPAASHSALTPRHTSCAAAEAVARLAGSVIVVVVGFIFPFHRGH